MSVAGEAPAACAPALEPDASGGAAVDVDALALPDGAEEVVAEVAPWPPWLMPGMLLWSIPPIVELLPDWVCAMAPAVASAATAAAPMMAFKDILKLLLLS